MSQYDELLSAIPVSQLAQQVGADEAEVSAAVQQVLPALVGGLSANARQPEGAAALTNALGDHTEGDLSDLSNVNTDDGAKIVNHIFGSQGDAVVNQLGGLGGGAGGGLIKKLLPILAPIVLSFLAKKLSGNGGLGGAMGDILGGATGGSPAPTQSDAAPQAPAGQGGVGDLLGDLLGGAMGQSPQGQGGQGGFGLDDLLGGLLGGKK
ncbi:DUF937 domain-containing protein [Ornithinimicrobium ciconiae]|uniref:DUF937 domain-containing protein n=1 Tax=Ornithinimicrobium ciconiae TaxID=2594265 RepID=A0A516GA28_9MICO|nr:DUF937 domain-containing protein [Ornithinimicrobium ciconiae]QDO88378.1 DUF937 domain-containing protein [Ornithinimicrobium ciconiae]